METYKQAPAPIHVGKHSEIFHANVCWANTRTHVAESHVNPVTPGITQLMKRPLKIDAMDQTHTSITSPGNSNETLHYGFHAICVWHDKQAFWGTSRSGVIQRALRLTWFPAQREKIVLYVGFGHTADAPGCAISGALAEKTSSLDFCALSGGAVCTLLTLAPWLGLLPTSLVPAASLHACLVRLLVGDDTGRPESSLPLLSRRTEGSCPVNLAAT